MAPAHFRPLVLVSLVSSLVTGSRCSPGSGPLIVNTWPFTDATNAAYNALVDGKSSALDAVEAGCATCESNPDACFDSVGFGGSPDENCETTLDAMIMDGTTMKSGSVAGLRRIKNAIGVARAVLEHTTHTMLAGDLATDFALANGFTAENLTTAASAKLCADWKAQSCKPNYRINVSPNATSSCGPYAPLKLNSTDPGYSRLIAPDWKPQASHDTISIIAIHSSGAMAAATSTNGANHKVPGRVGDGPITGSASYVDGDIGACGATGDGDQMMRFLPCYQAVESMRRGMSPREAAEDAVRRMLRRYPAINSGLVVVNNKGEHAGAASGWKGLPTTNGGYQYAVRGAGMNETLIVSVPNIVV